MAKEYSNSVFFNQCGIVEMEKGEGHLFEKHLTFPPHSTIMSNHIPVMDMIDSRSGKSVLDTAHALKHYMSHRIFESTKNRPEVETKCVCFRRPSDSPTY